MVSRRQFLATVMRIGPVVGSTLALCRAAASDRISGFLRTAAKARYWISTASPGIDCLICHKSEENLAVNKHEGRPPVVKCLLCPKSCVIPNGKRGACGVRMNINGELKSLVYGRPVAVHVDPIEKKPFYHFLPGSEAFSLATAGCPLRCKFCQNWEISQARPEDLQSDFTPPEKIIESASARGSKVIAFTYNEPTVFMEYLVDIAALAKKRNMRSVLVSSGYMNAEPLKEMCRLLDAIKIDLKGYSEDFYRDVCGGELGPVLHSIRLAAKSGIHLEIVNLVVPTLNDSEKMLKGLADWIMGEIGPDVPVHFTRFHPDYKLLNLPPTPIATLERARDIAMSRGLQYAYVGNVPGHPGNHTYCPQCGEVVIRRNAFFVTEVNLKNGKCKYCGKSIPGIWT